MDEVEPAPAYVAQMMLERYQLLEEIQRLREFVLSFPCTCWINKPKCVICQVKEGD